MSIEVPAYQAAGAARMLLEEAALASVELGEDIRAAMALSDEVKALQNSMTVRTRLEMLEIVSQRLDRASSRLEIYTDLRSRAEVFFSAAELMAFDHRNMITVPQDLVEFVLPYFDDAFEGFVQYLCETGAEIIEAQGLERDTVRASVTRYSPDVELGKIFTG